MKNLAFYFILCLFGSQLWGQSITISEQRQPVQADPSAILDLRAKNKGLLVPRLTTSQRLLITNPARGLLVYDLTDSAFYVYDSFWGPINKAKPSCIRDKDKDTQIQVEEGVDDDIIRMDISGTQKLFFNSDVFSVNGSFASGGDFQLAEGNNSFVGGGTDNAATGDRSFVGGGSFSLVKGFQSAVIGGQDNQISADQSSIAGGFINVIEANSAFIGGGSGDSALASFSFVGAGRDNSTRGARSGIAAGQDNITQGHNSFVGGGIGNITNSYAETVFGTYPTTYAANSIATISATDRLFNVGNGTSDLNRADAFTIRKDGRIGINDPTPSYLVDIFNNDRATRSLHINHDGFNSSSQYGVYVDLDNTSPNNGGTNYGYYSTVFSNNTNTRGSFFAATSSGTNSASSYGVYGRATNNNGSGVAYGVYGRASGSTSGAVYAGYFSGNVFTTGTYLPSDMSLKTPLQPSESVLDKVMQLQIANYSYLHEQYPGLNLPTGNRTGFVAQNVATLMPELVNQATQPATTKEEEESGMPQTEAIHFQAVDYAGMVPYLTKAIQEQQAMIQSLQKEVAELKVQLNK